MSQEPECKTCFEEEGSLGCIRPAHPAYSKTPVPPAEPGRVTIGEWKDYARIQFVFGDDITNAVALGSLAEQCRKANDKWWRNPKTNRKIKRNKGELLMLIVSELAEAMEGERKDLMDTHLPNRKMVEVELADALIRIFDYAGEYKLDIGGAFVEKMRYNQTRVDHSRKARMGKHGKKF